MPERRLLVGQPDQVQQLNVRRGLIAGSEMGPEDQHTSIDRWLVNHLFRLPGIYQNWC